MSDLVQDHFNDDIRQAVTAMTSLRAPADAWSRIEERVRSHELVTLPVDPWINAEPRTSGMVERYHRTGIAAALLLVLAAGAAALVYAGRANDWFIPDSQPQLTSEPVAPPVETPPAAELIIDGSGDLDVHIRASGPELTLRIRIGSDADAVMRATGRAALAQFRSGRSSLTITNASHGEIMLTLPAGRHVTRVLVDGRPWIEKRGADVVVKAPAADTSGLDVILSVPSSVRTRVEQ